MPDRSRRKDPDSGGGSGLPPEFGSLPEPQPRRRPSGEETPPGPTPPPPGGAEPPPWAPPADPPGAAPPPGPPDAGGPTDTADPDVIDLTDRATAPDQASRAADPARSPATTASGAGGVSTTTGTTSAPPTEAPATVPPEASPTPRPGTETEDDRTDQIPEWGAGPGWAPPIPPGGPGGPVAPGGPPQWGDGPRYGDVPPPPPPVVERPRRRLWPWFLWLAVLLLPLTLIGACTVLVFTVKPEPVDAVNDYMAAIEEGRFDDAYDGLCPELRAEISRNRFVGDYGGAERITGYQFVAPSALVTSRPTVSGLVLFGEEEQAMQFEVEERGDEWLICRYEPLAPPEGP